MRDNLQPRYLKLISLDRQKISFTAKSWKKSNKIFTIVNRFPIEEKWEIIKWAVKMDLETYNKDFDIVQEEISIDNLGLLNDGR